MGVGSRSTVYEIRDSTPGAVEAMLHHIYTGKVDAPARDVVPLFELAAHYELANLCDIAAVGLLDGLTRDNVCERVMALKRHCDHTHVKSPMQDMAALLQKDGDLLL